MGLDMEEASTFGKTALFLMDVGTKIREKVSVNIKMIKLLMKAAG